MAYCRACGDDHPEEFARCPKTGTATTEGPCGTTIDRYEIEWFVGGGGMGNVYRARHTLLGDRVAIKLLRPNIAEREDGLERFVREARAARALRSPHVIETHDCNVAADGTAYLVMELLQGRGLHITLLGEKSLAPARAVRIALEVLEGLRVAHVHGVVHRDMKPGNVFLRRTEEGGESATVLDFGTSKLLFEQRTSPLTPAGTMLGTPQYMAPEQIFDPDNVDHRADLYAVGVMLYEMLSGSLPFEGDTLAELMMAACSGPAVPLRSRVPTLPEALVAVVERAMARLPAARFQRAEDFISALSLLVAGRAAGEEATLRPSADGWEGAAAPGGETIRIERPR
jgi:serine/threonine-protein kinase